MANPRNVTSETFRVISVLYNTPEFSIAFGVWRNDSKHIAMRWNGADGEIGFPQAFGYSTWLLIPKDLSVAFTKSLLKLDNVEKQVIYQTLSELYEKE